MTASVRRMRVSPLATANPRPGAVRVAHLVSHPVQYFAPLYRELATRPELDLTVYFYADANGGAFRDPGFDRVISWDTDLLSGYRWEVLPGSRDKPLIVGPSAAPRWDIARALVAGGYDVVWAHGYSYAAAWLACATALLTGKTFMIREEANLLSSRPLHRRVLKAAMLRVLFSASWGLYIGIENRRYLERHGIAQDRLFRACYCVDNASFRAAASRLRQRAPELREKFGLRRDAPVVLFCGKLIPTKQPLRLVEAFKRVSAQEGCSLLIVGDGPLRQQVASAIDGMSNVILTGFLNQHEISEAYAASDLCVLPSAGETWGLTINEAMCFGLPVVASDRVGCTPDLVHSGWNGYVVPHDSTEALAEALAALVRDSALRAAFGANSLEIVESYSVEACADGIVAACLAATERRRLRAGRV